MIKIYNFSDIPINGAEVDDYCYSFAERYGENSDVFKAVDEEYEKTKSDDKTWVSFFNNLRKKLCEKGFEKEVLLQDEIFEKEVLATLNQVSKYSGKTDLEVRLSHTPMSERWENENLKFNRIKGKSMSK